MSVYICGCVTAEEILDWRYKIKVQVSLPLLFGPVTFILSLNLSELQLYNFVSLLGAT